MLAWWRTGLGALAVGFGVGRLVPELDSTSVIWPFHVLGLSFCLYGVTLILFGNWRFRALEHSFDEGDFEALGSRVIGMLGLIGALLTALTGALILFG